MDSLPAEPLGKPKNTGVGSLSLLQQIFLTQELNRGLLQADSLPTELSGKPFKVYNKFFKIYFYFIFWAPWVFIAVYVISLVVVRGLLIAVASLTVEHRL